ncbi:type-F conjugative transfer system pilin acetylase TraX [Kosakonia sacchari]|uniref:type-F conjugative transfer system pilin acetylase TraX n=1 Tax=Kosakonia sacchari TaxID=1158459 RepID=UPI002ACD6E3E|nr:type-F conjugative transfer system pilin acetylase TraX [Kosakonia sacchari]MDZ7320031.1 type-F conjugative transfer system pilin acetylase TraX [Kosakonia sacchari]
MLIAADIIVILLAGFLYVGHARASSFNISPLQRDVIRIVAFVAMLGDHIGTAFQPDMLWLNMAGRCAFPLFAMVSGCNLAGKSVQQCALNRLWLMALLAQPGFWLAFSEAGLQWWQLNILFTFAVTMQALRFMLNMTILNGIAAFMALVVYLPLSSASYGVSGLLVLAGSRFLWLFSDRFRPTPFAIWLLFVALLNARHGDVMMFSGVLLTLTVLFCVHGLVPSSDRRLQIGRWFAPAYIVHLLGIGSLAALPDLYLQSVFR